MQITARTQRFGSGGLRNLFIGLSIVGALAAGTVAYIVSIDESERVTGGNVPAVTQPDPGDEGVARSQIGRDVTAPDARTNDQVIFDEQNPNVDSSPPGRITSTDSLTLDQYFWDLEVRSPDQNATTLGGQVQRVTYDRIKFLEANTIFLPGDTGSLPPYADRGTVNF